MTTLLVNNLLHSQAYTCKSGAKLYFNFEKIHDTKLLNFWSRYSEVSSEKAQAYSYLCSSITSDSYPKYEDWSRLLGDEKHYHEVVQFIQRKGYFNEAVNPYREGGFHTMSSVLRDAFGTKKKIYIVFASTIPVTTQSPADLKFPQIVMSFVWLTTPHSPTVTHVGIFRNPSDFLEVTESHRGIAMPLHQFAAKVAMTYFSGKKYMVTQPMHTMRIVMARHLGSHLHLGSNLDLSSFDKLSDIEQNLLKKHPPILHVGKDGKYTIAKEGVDLSEYLDSIPEEKADEIMPSGETFKHYDPFTISAYEGSVLVSAFEAAIPLAHLAEAKY